MICTIPNIISSIRIGIVPVFVWLLLGRDDPTNAGWLLVGIGATDWIDGFLARRLDQTTELGKLLDPVADRLAVAAAVIGGWISGDLAWQISLTIIIREAVVGVGAVTIRIRTRSKVDVRYIGKVATAGIYLAIPLFLVGGGTDTTWLEWAAWITVIPSLILYYVVAFQYLDDMRGVLRARRAVFSDDNRRGDSGERS